MEKLDVERLKEYLGPEGVRIFLRCADCTNFEEIQEIKKILAKGEDRFKSGSDRMDRIERTLEENNKLTNDSSVILKLMHDRLFIDTPDEESVQTMMRVSSQKLTILWSIVIFLIISIAGIAFAIIAGAIYNPEERDNTPIIFTIPSREQIHVENTGG